MIWPWLMLGACLLFLLALRVSVTQVTAAALHNEVQAGKQQHIIDVREPHEFRQGHIPGARSVPLAKVPKALEGKLKQDEDIVLVCASGTRSAVAFHRLKKLGYKKARNLTGGMEAWELYTRRLER